MTFTVFWPVVRRPFAYEQDGQQNTDLSEVVLSVRLEVISWSVVIHIESFPDRTIGILSLRTTIRVSTEVKAGFGPRLKEMNVSRTTLFTNRGPTE